MFRIAQLFNLKIENKENNIFFSQYSTKSLTLICMSIIFQIQHVFNNNM